MYNKLILSFSIALLFIANGCSQNQTKSVKYGNISNKNITIYAQDKSFVLKAGETFTPPFSIDTSRLNQLHFAKNNLISLYKDALKLYGAKRVKVQVQGAENKTYYGILLLSRIFETGIGPGARSYLINIPDEYIKAANGGKISVVTEVYNRKGGQAKSWVLWLSDLPFEV